MKITESWYCPASRLRNWNLPLADAVLEIGARDCIEMGWSSTTAPSAGDPSALETMPLQDPDEGEATVAEGNAVRARNPISRSRRNIPEVYPLARAAPSALLTGADQAQRKCRTAGTVANRHYTRTSSLLPLASRLAQNNRLPADLNVNCSRIVSWISRNEFT
jgi:hypothetical protein